MALSSKQKSTLKALAHHLKPVVSVGQHGVSDAVVAETARALLAHELIKVRFHEFDDLDEDAAKLAERVSAELIAVRGKIAMLYQAHPETPKIRLPRA